MGMDRGTQKLISIAPLSRTPAEVAETEEAKPGERGCLGKKDILLYGLTKGGG